ncbi:MAG: hypothetical protein HY243_11215 [Proteobacteria bacterium]|nr:hypothetical protein [Pseudomonadota bacterium]
MSGIWGKAVAIRGAIGLAGAVVFGSAAHAELPLAAVLAQGKAIIDIRARYESVNDASKTKDAQAGTLRLRLGYETGYWNNLQLSFDFDQIFATSGKNFNSTRNGNTLYPAIADPAMTFLNRVQLTYASDFDTKFTVGRQRILFGNQRFVGNSGWRQHEQTFDAVSLVNTSVKDLTISYAYVDRVNRVFGPGAAPVPVAAQVDRFDSNSHLINAVYVGVDDLRLEAYAYLLDFHNKGFAAGLARKLSTATYGTRGEYHFDLSADIAGQANAEFAHQTNYAGNPNSFDLNYWLIEGSLTYDGFTGLAGYQSLGSGLVSSGPLAGKPIGFSTPLATLHAFDGWADLFLTTPANGLDSFYVKASYAIPDFFDLEFKSITANVIYYDFRTDRLGAGLGNEWDASLDVAVDKQATFLLKYASYNGAGNVFSPKDKSIFWVQTAYKF